MVEMIGGARVADLFMTARTFDGVEAERIGVVHASYPAEELDATVMEIVRNIALNAPLTLQLAKAAIHFTLAGEDAAGAGEIARARQACINSSDYVEGRREPAFSGE
jgi:enoyl-CoA hydratase/carnithine racemase